jgi:hypothetical protein
MSTLKVNTLEEATAGGATFFTAKAWVNFNGIGTVAIRQSGNVSSISDMGTGNYIVNFTAALPSASYAETFGDTSGINGHIVPFILATNFATYKTASSFRYLAYTVGGSLQDSNNVSLVITL